jgi:hypothetical protein
MKRILLWFAVVLLLSGCVQAVNENTPGTAASNTAGPTPSPTPDTADVSAPCPTEGEKMANYQKYLSESSGDYVGVYENTGSVTDVSYGYVGNNSGLAGFWLLFKLPEFRYVLKYLKAIYTNFGLGRVDIVFYIFIYAIPVIIYHSMYLLQTRQVYGKFRKVDFALYGMMIFLILTNSGTPGAFIYFQF